MILQNIRGSVAQLFYQMKQGLKCEYALLQMLNTNSKFMKNSLTIQLDIRTISIDGLKAFNKCTKKIKKWSKQY